jgi:uncharacterized protein
MGLTAIVKPTHECNLSCSYCYLAPNAESGRMTEELMGETMRQVAECSPDKSARFIWHGGEPLLMGIDFFRGIANVSKKLRNEGYSVGNSIQSNATLVDEEFLDFVEGERDFHFGFSLDGPEEVNDKTRRYADGRGAFGDIFKGIERTRKRNLSSGKNLGGGVILVLQKQNIHSIDEIYNFFNQQRIGLKMNHIIDSSDSENGISPREYALAMNSLFDRWIQDQGAIEIDPFSDYLGNLMTGRSVGCNHSISCRNSFVSIGPRGDIYPCGRFDGVRDFWMGNVSSGGLVEALKSPIQMRLASRGLETLNGCSSCNYGKICHGGCIHNAYVGGDVMGKDPHCAGYKLMYAHIEKFLHRELSKIELKGGKNIK